jgi:hypothetical protein
MSRMTRGEKLSDRSVFSWVPVAYLSVIDTR